MIQLRTLLVFSLIAVLCACSKQKNELPKEAKNESAEEDIPVSMLPPGTGHSTHVVLNSSGDYVTSYSGGINFESTFLYPYTIPAGQNGQPYAPSFGAFIANNLLSYHLNGAHFTMQQGTAVGGLGPNDHLALSNYYADFDKFVNGEISSLPSPDTYFSGVGGSADGILTTTGTFIYNSNSPTNVAITYLQAGPPLEIE
ncbi:MAG: hypothetical protein J0H92_20280 [Sphingobacteriales bacterium]|nr:hypothetical protein [Sphingobacteriales bacterium]OJW38497.1 MAG: hypothetical protein BGO54_13390 [Sphingobacteriales bacterium 46-32]